ncbi:MAG: hypothetical protein ACYS32_01545 [Planctomycetota bacterium]|jgi:prepilin-type processing-associated H-X9-DG protein
MSEEERKEEPKATVCKLAVISFLLAILSIPGIWAAYHNKRLESPILNILLLLFLLCAPFAIPAAIVGFISIVKIAKSQKRLIGLGIGIAGAIIGTIGITLWGQLMLSRIRSISPRMVCGSNMTAISRAMLLYADDYNGKLPTPSKWCDLLIEHGNVTKKHFKCRGAKRGPCNYAMNKNIGDLSMGSPDTVLIFEIAPGWNQVGGSEILTTAYHKWEGCNVLFLDFHVYFERTQDIPKLKWKAGEDQKE